MIEYDEGHQIPDSEILDAKNKRNLETLIGNSYRKAFQELFPDNAAGS